MMVPRLDKSKKPASLSKRIERFYDNPPGGRTLWVVVTGIGLAILGVLGALHEPALIALCVVCVGLTLLFWIVGIVWQFAIIKETEGLKGLVIVIFTGRLQYLNEHWDVLRRPVCLSAGGLLFLVYLLVPLSIYAVTHPS